jgi:hypothetical protein
MPAGLSSAIGVLFVFAGFVENVYGPSIRAWIKRSALHEPRFRGIHLEVSHGNSEPKAGALEIGAR